MTSARTGLTIALFGIAASPLLALRYGSSIGVVVALGFAAVSVALVPEPSRDRHRA